MLLGSDLSVIEGRDIVFSTPMLSGSSKGLVNSSCDTSAKFVADTIESTIPAVFGKNEY